LILVVQDAPLIGTAALCRAANKLQWKAGNGCPEKLISKSKIT